MDYISTRDGKVRYRASEAIVKGIAGDGGLFVPSSFPSLSKDDILNLCEMSYPERAAKILSLYLDDFSFDELLEYCEKAYARFDGDPCPVVKTDDGLFVLELWHGPTCAFKDMALTVLPYLLTASKKKLGRTDRTLVLVATSGDTGKAALEGFKDVPDVDIAVFYPSEGVSDMQKLQMSSQEGSNVYVAGIKGNFDDAQRCVKSIFCDESAVAQLANIGYSMSSANSINWGRLAPQIAYYVSAYCDLVSSGEIGNGDKVNFVVPTGNFGNALACYYAAKMGLPVGKIIIASNENNILSDFFASGEYDLDREFFKTISPSMDILVSSNLERLIFETCGGAENTRKLYADLKEKGKFSVNINKVKGDIIEAGWASEEETKETIYNFFEMNDYVLDPHTAVAASVFDDYALGTGDETPCVIVSTASPFKFTASVLSALGTKEKDAFKALDKLQALTALECPENLANLKTAKVRFCDVLCEGELWDKVLEFAKKNAEK